MLKLIDIDSSYFHDEPIFQLINITGSGPLLKQAADQRVSDFVSSMKTDPGKIYIHILAMGAGEFYGANRNADFFPEENLLKYHDTFVSSPAHIFKHHINKNPDIAIGQVIHSFYNDRMHRVELIAWVDKDKGYDYVARIERGEFPSMSMACHTPFDTCSICGNKARSRNQYCEHLRGQLGKILPDGRKVMAINDGPLRFFDQSFVFKPADVTSSVLQKVAYADQPVISSAEQAEAYELQEKKSDLRKASDLIKQIDGEVVGSSDSLEHILSQVQDPDDQVIHSLVHLDLHHVLHALAELGISPSIGFFAKMIGRKISGENVNEISALVEGMLKEDVNNISVPNMPMSKVASETEVAMAKSVLRPFYKQASLFPEAIMDRALVQAPGYSPPSFGDTNNVGYIGNGPYPAPDPREIYKNLKKQLQGQEQGMLKTLFLIGGAAVAAKWLLSKMIEEKVREQTNKQHAPVKIVLVKSAQEAFTTIQLAKAAFLREFDTE